VDIDDLREISSSLFVFRLLFGEKASEGYDVCVDSFSTAMTIAVAAHLVYTRE
jgi:hypothetical protein